jgi:predicted secreted hydrolase
MMRTFLSLLTLLLFAACSRTPEPVRAEFDVGELLSASADPRFVRATEPREFVFPDDHGPHPDFQTEWWYFTGTLADESGGEYGYQLTFFRRALALEAPKLDSNWASSEFCMAHFTLSSAREQRFEARERFERNALGLAGATSKPWRVWLRDWHVEGELDGGDVRLVARDGGLALDLVLRATRPVLLQGERGLSRKGAEPGNASYYYSIPRLDSRGTLAFDGRSVAVSGESWFDREWSTSALEKGQVGWDWFALRFDDGSDLMLYVMRRDDGSIDTFSSGCFSKPGSAPRRLAPDEFTIVATSNWTSPTSSATYPSTWRLTIPSLALECELEPLVRNCELGLSVRYWEGAVRANGTHDGTRVSGRGFVELTGY